MVAYCGWHPFFRPILGLRVPLEGPCRDSGSTPGLGLFLFYFYFYFFLSYVSYIDIQRRR